MEGDAAYRERTDSLKRKKLDSSGREEGTDEDSKSIMDRSILDALKLIRKDLDELKQKNDEQSGAVGQISVMSDDIKTLAGYIKDLKDCLKSVEAKFEVVEAKVEKQDKRIDNAYKRIEAQGKEIFSLKEELQKTKDRVVDTESIVEKSTDAFKKTQTQLKEVKESTIDLGARSRRNNLIFHGIKETSGETNDICKRKVKEFIKKNCKITDDFEIEVAHRLGRNRQSNTGTATDKPRPMIAKFLNRGERDTVWRTKYDLRLPEEYGITQDFPREIRLGRSKLIPRMLKAKDEGHEAYIVYPCRLFVDGVEVERIDPASAFK